MIVKYYVLRCIPHIRDRVESNVQKPVQRSNINVYILTVNRPVMIITISHILVTYQHIDICCLFT